MPKHAAKSQRRGGRQRNGGGGGGGGGGARVGMTTRAIFDPDSVEDPLLRQALKAGPYTHIFPAQLQRNSSIFES